MRRVWTATPESHARHLERGRRFWDRSAGKRRVNSIISGWQEALFQLAAEQVGLRAGHVVLDVGCGSGHALPTLRKAVGDTGRVVGVDYSPKMLAAAEEVVAAHGWDNVELRQVDLSADRLESGGYDAAVASYVLGAVPDIDRAVDVLHDALRPGGRVFVGDMAFGPHLPARLLRQFYRRVMTGNGADVRAALARRFEIEPAVDHRGRALALEPGRSFPPWTHLVAHRT